jgi:hypothetical protein
MTELVTSGSVGGMASNGCLYPEIAARLNAGLNSAEEFSGNSGKSLF